MEIPRPPIWNLFFLPFGIEKWGSGGEETSSPPRLRKREEGALGERFLPLLNAGGRVGFATLSLSPLHSSGTSDTPHLARALRALASGGALFPS